MVGFDVTNKNVLSMQFICPVCSLILRDPLRLSTCGHRCCRSCIHVDQQTQLIRCSQCQLQTPIAQTLLDRAFDSEIQSLPITCLFCQWTDLLKNYQYHLDRNHPTPSCPQCGEQCSSLDEFNQHARLSCPGTFVNCLLKDFGCHLKVHLNELSAHHRSVQHQQAVGRAIAAKNSQREGEPVTQSMETDLHSPLVGQELSSMVPLFQDGTQIIDEDMRRLNATSDDLLTRLQGLTDSVSNIRVAIEEQGTSEEAMKYSAMMLKQELMSMQENVDDLQHVSYDGTSIWKIAGVQEKMSQCPSLYFPKLADFIVHLVDAQSERQTSIYSPPFYSSPTGYKMRARLYLHGDGNARLTHMSLFFVLMRGPHDAILKFPFNFKVTFCLYDQTAQQRHIIDSFRPDLRSNSFQQPRSEMNIASGLPKFCSLEQLRALENPYVRNDTMFIKIMVDFGNLPKTMLPYALSLNPGLPMRAQQAFIQQEIEKRGEEQKS